MKAFHYLTILMLVLILPSSFLHEKLARIIFYWCGYISILGCLIEWRGVKAAGKQFKLYYPLLFIGLIYLIWSLYAKSQLPEGMKSEFLFTSAKRFLLSFVVCSYGIYVFNAGFINKKLVIKMAWSSVACAFMFASLYAVWQGFTSNVRVVLGINRATMTAYAYSALTMCFLTILLNTRAFKLKALVIFLVPPVSLYVILLTETRAAMAIHIVLLTVILVKCLRGNHQFKLIYLIPVLAAFVLCLTFAKKIIEVRLSSTVNEIHLYQKGNDHSSLGSRFTMWKTGLIAFKHAPFGETEQARNTYIKKYLAEHGMPRSYAINFLDVHLHNELIQYASLFGVAGIIVLLYFYFTLIFNNGLRGYILNPISMIVISTLLYGLTDVLLTSVEYIVMMAVMILLSKIILDPVQNREVL